MPSELFRQLMQRDQMHLRRCKNHKNVAGYKLYSTDMKPLRFYTEREISDVLPLLKKDHKGRLSLNFSLIRKLHGNDGRKRLYKKLATSAI